MKTISHEELLDKYIGKKETKERIEFENELKLEVLSYKLKELRKQRRFTQEELGKLIGKDKTQISKIEKGKQNLTISTILEIMKALDAKFKFRFEIDEDTIEFA